MNTRRTLAALALPVLVLAACAANGGETSPEPTPAGAIVPADETSGEPAAVVTDVTGTVAEVGAGSGRWSLEPDGETGQRYAPDNLAEEFRVEGLRVVFSGEVGEIPPNVRMWGTPLHLTDIRRLEEAPAG